MLVVPLPPQLVGPSHMPQSMVPPQLSAISPQFLPTSEQTVRGQPHTFGVPAPPQVSGSVHQPQWSLLPQPSSISSQFLASISQVVGTQPPSPSGPASGGGGSSRSGAASPGWPLSVA